MLVTQSSWGSAHQYIAGKCDSLVVLQIVIIYSIDSAINYGWNEVLVHKLKTLNQIRSPSRSSGKNRKDELTVLETLKNNDFVFILQSSWRTVAVLMLMPVTESNPAQ